MLSLKKTFKSLSNKYLSSISASGIEEQDTRGPLAELASAITKIIFIDFPENKLERFT
jgi:hypothetical protein